MVGAGDFLNVLVREFAGAAVDEVAQVARVDEEDFVLARVAVVAGAVKKPEGGRYLGVEEELGGQVDDAVDEVPSAIIVRMSPSPWLLVVREPLARTTPAMPVGAR